LTVIRHKAFAHRDLPTATGTQVHEPVLAADVMKVSTEFLGIINDIEGYFEESGTLFDMQVSFSNLPNSIKHLKRGIEAVEEDNRRKMERWMPKPAPEGTSSGEVQ